MSTQFEVKQFLNQLQQNIKIWGVVFMNRKDNKNNLQDLADLEITSKRREEIVINLTYKDYSQGPLPETQYGGKEMWVFGKTIKNQEIYIKLTINQQSQNAICISFHKAEHSMEYPLK